MSRSFDAIKKEKETKFIDVCGRKKCFVLHIKINVKNYLVQVLFLLKRRVFPEVLIDLLKQDSNEIKLNK
jgi:hypothetical protein